MPERLRSEWLIETTLGTLAFRGRSAWLQTGLSIARPCDNAARDTISRTNHMSSSMKEDLQSATKTYSRFVASLKYTIPALAVVVLLVLIMIAE